jgi:2-oxoisovalerate dehydrogenase E1 component
VLVLHEDIEFIGFGAEIAAQIAQFCFEYLDAPVQRVAGKYSWIAYAPPLEDALLPQKEDIDRAVDFLLKY